MANNIENTSKKQLYYVTTENTGQPLLMNREIILIYDDKTKAEASAKKLSEKNVNTAVEATAIEDNLLFFSKMAATGFNKFLLNGDGKILGASDFGYRELINITDNTLDLNEEIDSAQPTSNNNTANNKNKKTTPKDAAIAFIILLLFICFVGMIGDNSGSKNKSKSSSNKYRTKENRDIHIEFKEIDWEQHLKDVFDSYNTNFQSNNVSIDSDPSIPTIPYVYSQDYDINKIGDYEKTVKNYTSDIAYSKGTITNSIYNSEFIKLHGELEEGYSWMSSDELSSFLQSDTYRLDWECGVKGKTSDYKMMGIFTLAIGEEADFEKCLEVLKTINPGYTLKRSSSYGWFTSREDELDVDLQHLRAYNHAVFYSDSGIKREYYFNKVNDRLVCLISQYDKYNSNSSDEKIVEFVEPRS